MNLSTATVTGFFSLPSAALAEHNPAAYNAAMAGAPAGAGTCANCGTGIRHHVIVQTEDGGRHFIGTDCAIKVGGEPARCIGARLTSEQLAAREKIRFENAAQWERTQAAYAAQEAANREKFADALAALARQQTEFHGSLAAQLVTSGSLSIRQAHFVAKIYFDSARQNKRNRAQWEALIDLLTGSTYDEALNVEHGRLKGWLRSGREAAEELKDPEAAALFKTNLQLASGTPALMLK